MELRKVTLTDWKLLLDWRNDYHTRLNSHKTELVSEDTHKNWLQTVLANENYHFFIATENETPVGTVRADYSENDNCYELSWTISPDFRGKGIGKVMVKLLVERINGKVRAEIKKGNVASIKIAEYAGLRFYNEHNDVLHYSNF